MSHTEQVNQVPAFVVRMIKPLTDFRYMKAPDVPVIPQRVQRPIFVAFPVSPWLMQIPFYDSPRYAPAGFVKYF
jgi:hypothetical protein